MNAKTESRDLAVAVQRKLGKRLYGERWSQNANDLAKIELEGRSYYYSDDTRRFFGCRVLDIDALCDGLILGSVESVAPPSGRRLYRAAFFDLLGNIIFRTEHETDGFAGWATAKSARKEFAAYAETLDTATESARILEVARKELERDLRQLDQ